MNTNDTTKLLCTILLLITGFSNNSFFIISGFISYLLIKSFTDPDETIKNFKKYVKISFIITWIIPMFLSIILYCSDLLLHDQYGLCNYSDDYIMNIQKGLALLFFCYIFYQFCRLRVKVKVLLEEHTEVKPKKMNRFWIIYCVIIINIIC